MTVIWTELEEPQRLIDHGVPIQGSSLPCTELVIPLLPDPPRTSTLPSGAAQAARECFLTSNLTFLLPNFSLLMPAVSFEVNSGIDSYHFESALSSSKIVPLSRKRETDSAWATLGSGIMISRSNRYDLPLSFILLFSFFAKTKQTKYSKTTKQNMENQNLPTAQEHICPFCQHRLSLETPSTSLMLFLDNCIPQTKMKEKV